MKKEWFIHREQRNGTLYICGVFINCDHPRENLVLGIGQSMNQDNAGQSLEEVFASDTTSYKLKIAQ